MIRFFIFWLLVVLFCILGIILWPIGFLISLFSKETKDRFFYMFVKALFLLGNHVAGIDLTVHGAENIPSSTAVYIMNHRSIMDIMILYPLVHHPMGFVAKKELDHIPFFSWWMKVLNCVFLDRKDLRKGLKAIMKATDNVKNGVSMAIFPEGTRNKDSSRPFVLQEFRAGAMKLSTRSGAPIVPVAIYNSNNVFEDHKGKLTPSKVIISFGEPIHPDKLPKEEKTHLSDHVKEKIQNLLNDIQKEVA